MGASERRAAVLKVLCRRRHETIANLAEEFDVSERTIRRDVEILSYTEPIYTQSGRYGGGVYVTENYTMDKMYFEPSEAEIAKKALSFLETTCPPGFSLQEIEAFRKLVRNYTKPEIKTNQEKRSRT